MSKSKVPDVPASVVVPPVPSAIVEELEALFSRFLLLSPGLSLVLALWSLATHLHQVFDAFPYLAITSPTKRCGKTRVCELLSFVSLNPLQTVSISAAALYRILKVKPHTLLIDEAEYLTSPKDERASLLREILNAGYRRGQKVIRCKRTTKGSSEQNGQQENFEPESFETFGPKALVLIGRLQGTLADRCIEIRMERRSGTEIQRFRFARERANAAPLLDESTKWASDNEQAVSEYYQNNDVVFLHDREAELWLPLFSVCAVAAPHRLSELESTAKRLALLKSEAEPGDFSVELLRDIRQAFDDRQADRMKTDDLLTLVNSEEHLTWGGWDHGRGLSPHSLAQLLRPFGIAPQNIRWGEQVSKGYLRQSFEDCWKRYL
jgi:hypothetical protein